MKQIIKRVLVLDADVIPSLSIVRSLAKHNIKCDIASANQKPICAFSRYAANHFQHPDPLTYEEEFIKFISNKLQDIDYDLVIPVTERTIIPLANSKMILPWIDILAVAKKESLRKVLNKADTVKLANQLEIPIPSNHTISSLKQVENLKNTLEYPVVLKPNNSISNAGIRQQLTVTYAYNSVELIELSADLLKHCDILIQQYVQGTGVGVELLARDGEVIYAFQHERMHELPLTGGGSCLRKSTQIEPDLLTASELLMTTLNWHGVAMVEFKWDKKTGHYWLMEINGRFWGSLPLACAAGADFPLMLYKLLVLDEIPKSRAYKQNIFCRKLSADIYWYEQVIRRTAGSSILATYPGKKQLAYDAILLFSPYHYFDLQQWHDPIPGLVDIGKIVTQYSKRLFELFYINCLKKLHSSKFIQKCLEKKLKQSRNILYICYGNINRSILAQALSENLVASNSNKPLFQSAGFHLAEDRPADPNMIKVGLEHGINLSNERSKTITNKLVETADVIFVMEVEQLLRMKKEHPGSNKKIFLLGTLTCNENPQIGISDPYNKTLKEYQFCFKRISLAVNKCTKIISCT